MKSKLKVGDIVYYTDKYREVKSYCKIQRIEIDPKYRRGIVAIWGHWHENLLIAIRNHQALDTGWMPESECFLVICKYAII